MSLPEKDAWKKEYRVKAEPIIFIGGDPVDGHESDFEGYLSECENVSNAVPTLKRTQSSDSLFLDGGYKEYRFQKVSQFHGMKIEGPKERRDKKRRRKMNRIIQRHGNQHKRMKNTGVRLSKAPINIPPHIFALEFLSLQKVTGKNLQKLKTRVASDLDTRVDEYMKSPRSEKQFRFTMLKIREQKEDYREFLWWKRRWLSNRRLRVKVYDRGIWKKRIRETLVKGLGLRSRLRPEDLEHRVQILELDSILFEAYLTGIEKRERKAWIRHRQWTGYFEAKAWKARGLKIPKLEALDHLKLMNGSVFLEFIVDHQRIPIADVLRYLKGATETPIHYKTYFECLFKGFQVINYSWKFVFHDRKVLFDSISSEMTQEIQKYLETMESENNPRKGESKCILKN
uniref:Reverse transcriptase domain-containing protein n=1 Tax=Caenorhabditis tropicalis TaxID=1561998 RepID=A0A1I7UZE6_9PELO